MCDNCFEHLYPVKELTTKRENMSANNAIDREMMAVAACDIAGRARPLGSDIPMSDRVYLYACPDAEVVQFHVGELSKRLGDADLEYGVDWNKKSETFGVRFIHKASKVPPEIKPFTTRDARAEWIGWKKRELMFQSAANKAAKLLGAGEVIEFAHPERPLAGMGSLRKSSSRKERD